MKLPKIIGQVIFYSSYPAIVFLVRNSTRAYVGLISGDELLVTKNWLGRQNYWRLPGGGLKTGESPLAGVLRELQEEVGIVLNDSQLQMVTPTPIKVKNYHAWLFVVQVDKQNLTIKLPHLEIIDAQFVNIKKLSANHKTGAELRKLLDYLAES